MGKIQIKAETLLSVTIIEPDQTEHICVTEYEYLDALRQIAEQKIDGCKLVDNGKVYDIDKGLGAVHHVFCENCNMMHTKKYYPKGYGQYADACLALMQAQTANRMRERRKADQN